MLTEEKRRRLSKLYKNSNNPGSFGGVKKLYRAANEEGVNVSYSDVKKFLLSEPTYTIFHDAKKHFVRSSVFTVGIDDTWEVGFSVVSFSFPINFFRNLGGFIFYGEYTGIQAL